MRLAALALVSLAACNGDKPHLAVGAAASLRSAMPELAAAFEKQTGTVIDLRYGSSDVIAKQAHDGAALDAVILADESALDPALIASRQVIATNPIVLVGPAGTDTDFTRLAALPGGAKIAIGDPKSVPVGRYARTYLQELGTWDALQPQLALGGDAAAVLALAQSGTAKVAIVYKSDATTAAPLVMLDAPAGVPVANVAVDVLAKARHKSAAESFARFLMTPEAQKVLAAHQLSSPAPPVTTKKPPDQMDEKMRHCPLALDGATSSLQDIEGGVRFTIQAPANEVEEVRRRARHIVEFAAKRSRDGHGGFDGQGGGRMKNCPVVTDNVTITSRDIDGGAELDVLANAGAVDALRTMTRERVTRFPFTGATITQAR
jgi:molybdate transport system substrate-binding protein